MTGAGASNSTASTSGSLNSLRGPGSTGTEEPRLLYNKVYVEGGPKAFCDQAFTKERRRREPLLLDRGGGAYGSGAGQPLRLVPDQLPSVLFKMNVDGVEEYGGVGSPGDSELLRAMLQPRTLEQGPVSSVVSCWTSLSKLTPVLQNFKGTIILAEVEALFHRCSFISKDSYVHTAEFVNFLVSPAILEWAEEYALSSFVQGTFADFRTLAKMLSFTSSAIPSVIQARCQTSRRSTRSTR